MDYAIQDLSDGERVVLSANLLDTSEFEIFRRAHTYWHECEVDDQALEQEFSQYLHLGQAPPWVRHYTRMLLRREQQPVHITSCQPISETLFERLMGNRVMRFLFS